MRSAGVTVSHGAGEGTVVLVTGTVTGELGQEVGGVVVVVVTTVRTDGLGNGARLPVLWEWLKGASGG